MNGKKLRFKSMGRFFLCVIGVLFIYAMGTVFMQYNEYQKRSAEVEDLREQVEQSTVKKEELQHKLDYSKTTEYIESVAREKLGWVKAGEKRFVEKE